MRSVGLFGTGLVCSTGLAVHRQELARNIVKGQGRSEKSDFQTALLDPEGVTSGGIVYNVARACACSRCLVFNVKHISVC